MSDRTHETMNDEQLLRYSRQIMLSELDVAGQEALLAGSALIVGLGGLGSPAALYLAASGVGRLLLADHDKVEHSNLQRQIAHGMADLDTSKTRSAHAAVAALNPDVTVETLPWRLEGDAVAEAVSGADVVLDCTDNVATRYAVNRACLQLRRPLVSGAAIRFEGQVSVFDPREADSPCYRCFYPDGEDAALNCAENGVIAPLVGVLGAVQAMEAVKLLTGIGRPLVGRVLAFDALAMRWDELLLKRREGCPDCGTRR